MYYMTFMGEEYKFAYLKLVLKLCASVLASWQGVCCWGKHTSDGIWLPVWDVKYTVNKIQSA